MEDTQRESDMIDDGIDLGPVEYFNMIERMMYNRRYVTGMRFRNTCVINYLLAQRITRFGTRSSLLALMRTRENHFWVKSTQRLVIHIPALCLERKK